MNGQRPDLMLPGIAALVAFFFLLSPAKVPPRDADKKSDDGAEKKETADTQKPVDPLGRLLRGYFGDNEEAPDGEPFAYVASKEHSLEYMIVTVPDPQASSFDYTFDRHLDAVRYALEGEGFLLDRSRLPSTAAPGASSPWEDGYGVVLLRHKSEPRLYALILVGETATAGIDKKAFRSAIEQLHVKERCAAQPAKQMVSILGPTFSGATVSLTTALDDARDALQGCAVRIVSGSASDPRNLDAVKKLREKRSLDVTFEASVAPDDIVICALYQYITGHLHVPLDKIALLRESNTQYGNDYQAATSKGRCALPLISIPFPMHIAELRNAREKSRNAEQPALPSTQFSRRLLQLSLDNPNAAHAVDRLTTQSDVTKFSVELQTESIFRTLCAQDIAYTGLIATDAKDVIELAQEAHKYCPGMQLFSVGVDNFFFHDDLTSDLKEMLIASSYPLYDRNHLWSGADDTWRNLIQFPTDATQGVYNAALILFGEQPYYQTLAKSDEHNDLVEYGVPLRRGGTTVHPPVWISSIGNGGAWPVAVVPFEDDGGYVHRAEAGERSGEVKTITPSLFAFLVLIVSLVLGVASIGAWRVLRGAPEHAARGSRFWLLFEPLRGEGYGRVGYSAFGMVLTAALTAPVVVIAWLPVLSRVKWIYTPWWALAVSSLALLSFVGAAIVFAARFVTVAMRGEKRSDVPRCGYAEMAGAAVMTLGLCAATSLSLVHVGHERALLFFERVTNLSSGLSVVPATLILAVLFVSIAGSHLRRVRLAALLDGFTTAWSTNTGATHAFTLDPQLRRRTHCPWFLGWQNILLVGGAAAVPFVAALPKTGCAWLPIQVSFEGIYFSGVAHALLVGSYVATWALCARTFTVWYEARAVLRSFGTEAWFDRCRGWTTSGPLDGIRTNWVLENPATWAVFGDRLRRLRGVLVSPDQKWDDKDADGLLALVVVSAFARRQLSALLVSLTVLLLGALLLASCYPFETEHTIVATTWWLAVLVALFMMLIVVEQNRNEVVSVLDGSQPNKLTFDRDFLSRFGLHGLLPIVALGAAHSPAVSQFVSSWIQPLSRFFGN